MVDAVWGERHRTFGVLGTVNPDQAVLRFHIGNIEEPFFVFAKILRDECEGADG